MSIRVVTKWGYCYFVKYENGQNNNLYFAEFQDMKKFHQIMQNKFPIWNFKKIPEKRENVYQFREINCIIIFTKFVAFSETCRMIQVSIRNNRINFSKNVFFFFEKQNNTYRNYASGWLHWGLCCNAPIRVLNHMAWALPRHEQQETVLLLDVNFALI